MSRLRYRRGQWFKVWEVLTGWVDLSTGIVHPDALGCTRRRYLIGPFDTAKAAINA